MKKLKKLLLTLLLFLQVAPLLFSQSYYITEEQMEELEKTYDQQMTLITELQKDAELQKKQIENLQMESETLKKKLKEANQSLSKSEINRLRNSFFIGSCLFVVGACAGSIGTYYYINSK